MPNTVYIALIALGLGGLAYFLLVAPKSGGDAATQRGSAGDEAKKSDEGSSAKAPDSSSSASSAKAAPAQDLAAATMEMPKAEMPSGELPTVEEDDEPTGPIPLILVTAVGRTDPGLKRRLNEDAYLVLPNHHVFAVADGMGRHAAGEVASKLAVECIETDYRNNSFDQKYMDESLSKQARRIKASILRSNEVILKTAMESDEYRGMGTTLVCLSFSPNNQRLVIAHAGDSRCYRIRNGDLRQLTTDHTLGAAGIKGPSANVLSRAVGIEEHLDVELRKDQPEPDDLYVICSDGLSRMVDAPGILNACLKSRDLDSVAANLIDLANEGGGRDNVTVILVRVEEAVPT